jgi:hypothetical protein
MDESNASKTLLFSSVGVVGVLAILFLAFGWSDGLETLRDNFRRSHAVYGGIFRDVGERARLREQQSRRYR